MSPNPERFAQIVLAAFADAGLHTDAQIIKAGGPSTSTMTTFRKVADPENEATMGEPREPTWSKVDAAAGWESGSARRVWAGEDPVGGAKQDADYVASPGDRKPAGVTNDEVLRELRAMQQRIEELSQRLADG